LLIAFYHLLLEKEKMYRFNRFYLLLSILLSYTVPFISVTAKAPEQIKRIKTAAETTLKPLYLSPGYERFSWVDFIWIIYGTVTLVIFTKAVISFFKIIKLEGSKIIYQGRNILLTEQSLSPFSFLSTLYVGKNYFADGMLDPRIFLHEECHLKQRHSLDLLLAELFRIFTWFNPAVYLYKRAIITNHEFLADEAVLEHDFHPKDYQNLILQEIISTQNYNLTHTFHFKNTKKRFLMMNRKKSRFMVIKRAVTLILLLLMSGIFVQKTYARPVERMIRETQKNIPGILQHPVTVMAAQKVSEPAASFITDGEEPEKEKAAIQLGEEKISDTIRPREGKNTGADFFSEPMKPGTETTTEFPGGYDLLTKEISLAFNARNVKGVKGLIRSSASITIDEKGNLKLLSVSGDNETISNEIARAAFAVLQNKKWTPGTKDGIPVESRYNLPLFMHIE